MVTNMDELLESWLISLRAERKSPATIRAYSAAVRGYLAGHDELTRNGLREWLAGFSSASTANAYGRAVRGFSRWLFAEGESDRDILEGVKLPPPADRLVNSLSPGEVAAMRKACQVGKSVFRNRRDAAMFEVMLSTGVRAEELLALKVADIDLRQMTAFVERGKGGRPRIVAFGPEAAKAVDRWMRARRKHTFARSQWLWISERGHRLSYTGLFTAMRQRASQAGVEHFHPHRLRHTSACAWLQAGGSEGAMTVQFGWRGYRQIERYTADQRARLALDEARRVVAISN